MAIAIPFSYVTKKNLNHQAEGKSDKKIVLAEQSWTINDYLISMP